VGMGKSVGEDDKRSSFVIYGLTRAFALMDVVMKMRESCKRGFVN
jgi:hypothetical protein